MNHQDYATRVRRSITVGAAPDDVYRLWREPAKLASCLSESGSIDVVNDRRARWKALAPGVGCQTESSETLDDRPGQAVAWRTSDGGGCGYEARVEFRPAPRNLGTEVTLEIGSERGFGGLTGVMAKLAGRSPEEYAARVLRNLKQLVETGEIASNEGPFGERKVARSDVSRAAMAAMGLALFAGVMGVGRSGRSERSRRSERGWFAGREPERRRWS